MAFRSISILLLFSLTTFGQALTPLRPFILTSAPVVTPSLCWSNSAAYIWDVASLGTNAGTAVSWTDKLQGVVWTNGYSAARPSFTTNGVQTDAGHYFTNDGSIVLTTNCAFGFIWQVTATRQDLIHPMVLTADATFDGSGPNKDLGFTYSGFAPNQGKLAVDSDSSASNPLTGTNFDGLAGQYIDTIVMQQINATNSSYYTYQGYTNGALDKTVWNGSSLHGWWGNPTETPRVLGHNMFRNSGPTLILREFWIWTNTVPVTVFCDTLVSNFHYYGTNRWHYSP